MAHLKKSIVCIFFACLSLHTWAQTYPNKPIRFFLPNGPGGIGDLTARIVSQKVSEKLGQQIVIENRPSAAGVQAFSSVLQAPADGYTLALIGNGASISHTFIKKLPFNVLKDFEAVNAMAKFSLVLLVNQNSKFSSLKELIEYAKNNPNQLNLGAINIGSTQNLGAELFVQMAGIQAQVVPFNSSAGVISALKTGDIDLAFEYIGPVYASINSGFLRALAIASPERNPNLPNVPTAAENGLSNYEVSSWNAVFVKSGTPKAIVQRLQKEYAQAMNDKEVIAGLKNIYAEPMNLDKEATQQLLINDVQKWSAVIQNSKLMSK